MQRSCIGDNRCVDAGTKRDVQNHMETAKSSGKHLNKIRMSLQRLLSRPGIARCGTTPRGERQDVIKRSQRKQYRIYADLCSSGKGTTVQLVGQVTVNQWQNPLSWKERKKTLFWLGSMLELELVIKTTGS